MIEKSQWTAITEENPGHSAWYIKRFEDMRAEGRDLHGEARLIDAMVGRGSTILDAGCGPGRVAGRLAELGHTTVGVDVDPVLIEAATNDFPECTWITQDLATLDLANHGITEGFDAIVSAGNVMTFLAASTRQMVLANLGRQLKPEGRLVVGFGTGRDYEFDEFFADVESCDLEVELKLSTWDVRPFGPGSDFLVAVLTRR